MERQDRNEIDVLTAQLYQAEAARDYTDGTNEILISENQRLTDEVARLKQGIVDLALTLNEISAKECRDSREEVEMWQVAAFRAETKAEQTKEILDTVSDPEFWRPLIKEQSEGEWSDETIESDVATFIEAIRAVMV